MTNLPSSLLECTVKERIYIQGRLDGLTQKAAGAAAGLSTDFTRLEKEDRVQRAMVAAMSDLADEIGFSRKDAHDMLMAAYMNAATAAEQIAAVKEMINLHGIAAPKVVEHEHTHTGSISLESMELHELMKIADMEGLTLEGEYEVIKEEDGPDDTKALPEL